MRVSNQGFYGSVKREVKTRQYRKVVNAVTTERDNFFEIVNLISVNFTHMT